MKFSRYIDSGDPIRHETCKDKIKLKKKNAFNALLAESPEIGNTIRRNKHSYRVKIEAGDSKRVACTELISKGISIPGKSRVKASLTSSSSWIRKLSRWHRNIARYKRALIDTNRL